jgi:rhodanese-related sulfurtransferase
LNNRIKIVQNADGFDMTVSVHRYLAIILLLAASGVVAQTADYMSPGLTAAQLMEKLDAGQAPMIVDVRKPVEFGVAHIPGAVNIPVDEIEGRLSEFSHGNDILVYCINGSRTRQAEAILLSADIPNVYHLEGTFTSWIRDKHPVEKGGVKKTGW